MVRYESDYLDDLQFISNQIRAIRPKARHDGLEKALDALEDEMFWEVEALKDAEEVRKSDEEDYQSRND